MGRVSRPNLIPRQNRAHKFRVTILKRANLSQLKVIKSFASVIPPSRAPPLTAQSRTISTNFRRRSMPGLTVLSFRAVKDRSLVVAHAPQNAILRYARLQICATPKNNLDHYES